MKRISLHTIARLSKKVTCLGFFLISFYCHMSHASPLTGTIYNQPKCGSPNATFIERHKHIAAAPLFGGN
jgi:hypothetical protein